LNRDSLVFAVSGAFFGLLVGWILGAQQMAGRQPAVAAPPAEQQTAAAPAATAPQPKPVDPSRARALEAAAAAAPRDATPRVELGNLYFDAEQYDQAIRWYENALKIQPKAVDVSTDLGVAYYYSNQPDRAIEQLNHSLSIDPRHAKTLLNLGIVRAFGKQDLKGASDAWQKAVEVSPDSEEGRAAKRALDAVRSAHPDTGAGPSTPPARGGN
jgi:cytochrome c-type biogenesis protein CcmH/NrfG